MAFGSDAIALALFTDEISYLDEGDWWPRAAALSCMDAAGHVVTRGEVQRIGGSLVDKGVHYLREGDPRAAPAVGHIAHYSPGSPGQHCRADRAAERAVRFRDRAHVDLAHGTAYYALISTGSSASRACPSRSISRPSSAIAKRRSIPAPICSSPVGQTADTLATLRYARECAGAHRLPPNADVDDHRESDDADARRPRQGRVHQEGHALSLMLACLAIAAGRARGVLGAAGRAEAVRALIEVPRHMTEALALELQRSRRSPAPRMRATCSNSAAAPATRSRSRARSSSRKSPTSMPKAMRRAN